MDFRAVIWNGNEFSSSNVRWEQTKTNLYYKRTLFSSVQQADGTASDRSHCCSSEVY
jgi:hypothetical protein